MGEALKNQSDMIMNETFTRDIAYRKCYIDDKPVDAKYITYTYYSISKDAVDYHYNSDLVSTTLWELMLIFLMIQELITDG